MQPACFVNNCVNADQLIESVEEALTGDDAIEKTEAQRGGEVSKKIAEEFFMLTAIDCINISIGPDVKLGN